MQLTLTQIAKFRACLKRELNKRKYVYPKLVESGRMTKQKSDDEIKTVEDMITYFDLLQIHTAPEQQKLF